MDLNFYQVSFSLSNLIVCNCIEFPEVEKSNSSTHGEVRNGKDSLIHNWKTQSVIFTTLYSCLCLSLSLLSHILKFKTSS